MKLNKDGKKAIRDFIAGELNKIPFDCDSNNRQYVKFDKEFLEYLIFDESSIYGKYPAWTGKFLRRIDLSEVSFDDVCFDGKSIASFIPKFCIDLSYTNASIDFSKTDEFRVSLCNFSHVDLSNSNINNLHEMDSCDFSYSRAKFDFDILKKNSKSIINCNFEGINLSKCRVKLCDIINHFFKNCNFCNTAITIECDLAKESKESLKKLGTKIKNKHLSGCYLNDRQILTKSALKMKRENAKLEYDEYIQEIKQKIKTNIDSQIKKFHNE